MVKGPLGWQGDDSYGLCLAGLGEGIIGSPAIIVGSAVSKNSGATWRLRPTVKTEASTDVLTRVIH
jgi:hypothetical protein